MLRLLQFEGENFHQYFTRLHEYVDDLSSLGYQYGVQEMCVCIFDGMNAETRSLVEHISNGGLLDMGLFDIWDIFCRMRTFAQ